jgi:hypothetical protein
MGQLIDINTKSFPAFNLSIEMKNNGSIDFKMMLSKLFTTAFFVVNKKPEVSQKLDFEQFVEFNEVNKEIDLPPGKSTTVEIPLMYTLIGLYASRLRSYRITIIGPVDRNVGLRIYGVTAKFHSGLMFASKYPEYLRDELLAPSSGFDEFLHIYKKESGKYTEILKQDGESYAHYRARAILERPNELVWTYDPVPDE